MATDWQVGDLAVCIDATPRRDSNGFLHSGEGLVADCVYRVVAVGADEFGPLIWLDDDTCSQGRFQSRFRKIRPDAHEACEAEFVTLLKRAKRPVSA